MVTGAVGTAVPQRRVWDGLWTANFTVQPVHVQQYVWKLLEAGNLFPPAETETICVLLAVFSFFRVMQASLRGLTLGGIRVPDDMRIIARTRYFSPSANPASRFSSNGKRGRAMLHLLETCERTQDSTI